MTQPARQQSVVGEINTLLGRGSEFEGKLTFEGTVRIDGKLKGEVFSDDVLVIGEGAEVDAEIDIGEIIIQGTVVGNIRARRAIEIDIGEIIIQGTVVGNIRARRAIEIHSPGRVKGDLTTPSLQVDKGVIFEGRSFMEGVAEKLSGGASSAKASSAPRPATAGGSGNGGGGGGSASGELGGGKNKNKK